jgi:methylamine dehydrogenase light chain
MSDDRPGIDRWLDRTTRRVARTSSRRGFLAKLGTALLGGSALPLLPIARAAHAREGAPGEPDPASPEGDPKDCAYWRYCSIDGFLSPCCGGTHASCPPGTEMSSVTWIGTCRNPADGRDYVISYNDCCGQSMCGNCFCRRNEGDKPIYYTHKANDIVWCMGNVGIGYNSTVAIVVGVATEADH